MHDWQRYLVYTSSMIFGLEIMHQAVKRVVRRKK